MPDTSEPHSGLAVVDEVHRSAFNTAFCKLGLRWYWDSGTYRNLLDLPAEDDRIRAYMETHQPHLLASYDAAFLVGLIRETKARYYAAMMARGGAALLDGRGAGMRESELGEVGY